jgi:transcriptional regulator with XRE-family HTH domain
MVKMTQRDSTPFEPLHGEIGAFLRSRRERLTPADVGLPSGFRRRTPGLRRDEVAQLAGIGATWYTWLEQGRDVRASAEVLTALADALKLDPVERRHLFVLSDRQPPQILPSGPESVEPALQRMLDGLTDQPAYITGRRWDILAWNHAATMVFGDYAKLQGDERNLMHMVFANPRHRKLLIDWDELAPVALAMFRADCTRYAGDADFERLVTLLKAQSSEFKAWWQRHEVTERLSSIKRIAHPRKGRMAFEYVSLAVADGSDRKMTVYTPLAEHNTASKLTDLLRLETLRVA